MASIIPHNAMPRKNTLKLIFTNSIASITFYSNIAYLLVIKEKYSKKYFFLNSTSGDD